MEALYCVKGGCNSCGGPEAVGVMFATIMNTRWLFCGDWARCI